MESGGGPRIVATRQVDSTDGRARANGEGRQSHRLHSFQDVGITHGVPALDGPGYPPCPTLPIHVFINPLRMPKQTTNVLLFTDASKRGVGAHTGDQYFSGNWPAGVSLESPLSSTAFIEIAVVAMALEVWGPQLRGKHVLIWCDNQAAVKAWTAGRSASPRRYDVIRKNAHANGVGGNSIRHPAMDPHSSQFCR